MARTKCVHKYEHIISIENLLFAWKEFLRGKKMRKDVLEFEQNLMGNIFSLHKDLLEKKYTHSDYHAFNISDPKPRSIHKASVRDRLLHHAIYRVLYRYFDQKFIYDSYSCRLDKGTHKAMERFRSFARKVSKNNTRTCWVLKCDIRKFFANIDHTVLKSILAKYLQDRDLLWLLDQIIDSFHAYHTGKTYVVGLPLGNLTSQLLVNIFMNEFDQYMKHSLKTKYYIRYADDFVIMSEDKKYLENLLPQISDFLKNKLKLELHPDKVFTKTLFSGVDFLGWVHFPTHQVLRGATKRRMWKRLTETGKEETRTSYLGMLSHGDAYGLRKLVQGLALYSHRSDLWG